MEFGETGNWRGLYEELKRRRVIRAATLYVVVFWPIIQIVDILSPAIDLGPDAMRYLLTAFVAGLPVAIGLSWIFDLSSSGVVRANRDEPQQPGVIGRGVEWTIIAVLLMVIAVLFYLQNTVTTDGTSAVGDAADQPVQTAAPKQKVIAVLPFVSFSLEAADQFFSDGLTEELLNVLSKVKDLRVIARTSSFAYKGVNKPVQEIGRELNVNTILEGSVRRNDVDNRIRVTAQLIDVETGTHLWSKNFDKEFRGIFQIQDEIAAAVVDELQVTLFADRDIKSRESASSEAVAAYSRGQSELAKRSSVAVQEAIGHFEQAIELDPEYTEAHAALANAFVLAIDYADVPMEQNLPKARAAMEAAALLDPESAETWAARGLIHMRAEERDLAMSALAKAMERNPSHAMANMWYGSLQDDPIARRRFHRRAFELDPKSPVAGYNVASDLVEDGREAEAMAVFGRIVEADPHYAKAYMLVGEINEFRGRLDEALRHYEKVFAMEPNARVATRIAEVYVDIGDFDSVDHWMQIADESSDPPPSLAWVEVSAAVARGDQERAMDLLAELGGDGSTLGDLVNATLASYFLEDYEATIAAFDKAAILNPDGALRPKFAGPDPAVAAAFAYKQTGQISAAENLLAQAEEHLDHQIETHPRVSPELWYNKAQIMAIRGDTAMAVMHLKRAVAEGWRQHWRPMVDPSMSALLDDADFRTLMMGLSARMELMREQIAFAARFDDWRG